MNTPEGNWASAEAVLDVSIIIPLCFNNPLKKQAVNFISDVLDQRRRAVLPVTTIIGAYHIATRYLKTSKLIVKRVLDGLLRTRSPALCPHITTELATDALEYATAYNVESWDGYLAALARNLGTTTIYTLDKEMSKIKEITTANPFPEQETHEYHRFIEDLIG